MNRKIKAGQRVAERLFPAENSIDDAILQNAALMIALINGRKEAQLPATEIQDMLRNTAKGIATLIEGRGAICVTHSGIVELRDRHGLPTRGFGCESPCPTEVMPGVSGEQQGLSVVA
ncbi:hypothetical protein [Sphingomonas sp.]|uniref:hypothetical protein n=1 Tax=Sphingomonas sp. TaxID=28214 RepID=UPI001B16AA7E|nr:hypothetical protein [Sphingomonas sp.]MBO9711911.1 hypothetical protein [Sphingomonas sp.]